MGAFSPAVSSHPNPQAIMLQPRPDLLEDTVARTATALVETLSVKICFGSPSCKHARRVRAFAAASSAETSNLVETFLE